jgi:hypothetical protein
VDDLYNLGRNAMNAMANGIRAAGSAVWRAAQDVAQRAWDAVSSLWKIRSPSRVFMDIGHDAMAGLAIGISDAERMVTGAMGDVAGSALPSIDVGGGRGGGNIVINVSGALDAEGTARTILRVLRDAERRTGERLTA